MSKMPPSALARYVESGRETIPGWLSRVDAEIFLALSDSQVRRALRGSMAEIGVHHGKFFVALCMALTAEERSYGIDIFDAQHLNKDDSGSGSRRALEGNIVEYGVDPARIVIDPRPSQDVVPSDILNSVGPVRFFSVDGGHWLELVQSDLTLAEAVLADHGIIALDDFHRAEWPDVSAGYFAWKATTECDIVPFAIGFNKIYLCRRDWVIEYKEVLQSSLFLRKFLVKEAEFMGDRIYVYQSYPLPEWAWRLRIIMSIKTFMPSLYAKLFGRRVARLPESLCTPSKSPVSQHFTPMNDHQNSR